MLQDPSVLIPDFIDRRWLGRRRPFTLIGRRWNISSGLGSKYEFSCLGGGRKRGGESREERGKFAVEVHHGEEGKREKKAVMERNLTARSRRTVRRRSGDTLAAHRYGWARVRRS